MLHSVVISARLGFSSIEISPTDSEDQQFFKNILYNNTGIERMGEDRTADLAVLEVLRVIEFTHVIVSISSFTEGNWHRWHIYYRDK